jgi:hypothetical protein
MVRALLDGRKTQTRRVVKAGPNAEAHFSGGRFYFLEGTKYINCPYGAPGDRLWVRENHWCDTRDPNECVIYSEDLTQYKYRTGGKGVQTKRPCTGVPDADAFDISKNKFWKHKPSIFMPRWVSRILLEVTDVRVERVQDISEGDAQAEGIVEFPDNPHGSQWGLPEWSVGECQLDARNAFWHLFYGIGKRVDRTSNPRVWVVKFKKL